MSPIPNPPLSIDESTDAIAIGLYVDSTGQYFAILKDSPSDCLPILIGTKIMLQRQTEKFVVLAIFAIANAVIVNHGLAQDSGLFSGSGISMKPRSKEGNNWTRTMDFSTLSSPKGDGPSRFQLPKFAKPKWQTPKFKLPNFMRPDNYPKPTQLSDKPGFFERMPNFDEMFPPRDPNEPSYFERANARNKQFWGETREKFTNWSIRTNEKWKKGTTDSWNSLTRGPSRKLQPESQSLAQPPLRSANRFDGPRKRF